MKSLLPLQLLVSTLALFSVLTAYGSASTTEETAEEKVSLSQAVPEFSYAVSRGRRFFLTCTKRSDHCEVYQAVVREKNNETRAVGPSITEAFLEKLRGKEKIKSITSWGEDIAIKENLLFILPASAGILYLTRVKGMNGFIPLHFLALPVDLALLPLSLPILAVKAIYDSIQSKRFSKTVERIIGKEKSHNMRIPSKYFYALEVVFKEMGR